MLLPGRIVFWAEAFLYCEQIQKQLSGRRGEAAYKPVRAFAQRIAAKEKVIRVTGAKVQGNRLLNGKIM